MGNAVASPCCFQGSGKTTVKLVFWEGTTRAVAGGCLAGEIMFQFPDRVICHADSFFIGREIPALQLDDELVRGQTYFVLPVDRFACGVLSAKSLAAFAGGRGRGPIDFGHSSPFQQLQGADGRTLVKISPEFIMRVLMSGTSAEEGKCGVGEGSPLCSTPELQKHYAMLVGSREQVWSPKLETISEKKGRLSPYRLLGLDWRSEKMEG